METYIFNKPIYPNLDDSSIFEKINNICNKYKIKIKFLLEGGILFESMEYLIKTNYLGNDIVFVNKNGSFPVLVIYEDISSLKFLNSLEEEILVIPIIN